MTDSTRVDATATVRGALRTSLRADRDAVVATVVDVEGSAYRRPGAKIVVDADGTITGHITAGCLEDPLRALATAVRDAGEPRLETYDLVSDDDIWGLGVGCNGIVDVLVEPLGDSYAPVVDALADRTPVSVVTVLEGEAADGCTLSLGAKALYCAGEVTAIDDAVPRWLCDAVKAPAAEFLEADTAGTITLETDAGEATVFVDGLQPAPRLAILGSGNDVRPVVERGAQNGFHVTVAGFRGAIDLEQRFPRAADHVSTAPAAVADALEADDRTYVVVMSHNIVDDRLALEALLETDVPYIGLLGPRSRFEEILEASEQARRLLDADGSSRLYAPVGLDLGSGSPHGIATSIVAEVLAVHNDREPRHLSERSGPIHDRIDSSD